MIRYAMIPLALTLSACGSGGEANNSAQADDSVVAPQAPANLQDDPGNTAVPIGNAASDVLGAVPVDTIPAPFRGRWGMVAEDCDPNRDDNKGLMTVTADTLRFYESRAGVADLRHAGAVLTGTLSFSGEGQTWRQQVRLTLLDGGNTLVRTATGGDVTDEGTARYARCPAPEGAA